MKTLHKEPLLHFLILAVGLFVLHSAVSHEDDAVDSRRIVVDQENLLTFIQYRTKVFEPKAAEVRLDSLSDEALKRVVDDYVREEALHREALALGLERDDYVIKRRLIQKMDFVTQGFGDALINPSAEEIQQYYEKHKQEYYVQPTITFTHIFFDAARHGQDKAIQLAKNKLKQLTAQQVTFVEAAKHGERFLYGMNYVERSEQYVRSHFGGSMTDALLQLSSNETQWHGPYQSQWGAHLVMVSGKQDGRYPDLVEMRKRVEKELRREQIREMANQMAQQIIDTYDVQVEYQRKEKLAQLQK